MSVNTNRQPAEVTPTYLRGGDPALADYYPAWLGNLADDVTLEGSLIGRRRPRHRTGSTGCASSLSARSTTHQQFHFAGAYGENGCLEDYTAQVRRRDRLATAPSS